MKKEVLEALIKKWRNDIQTIESQNGGVEAVIENAKAVGLHNGVTVCIDDLESLMKILMD